MVKSSFCVVRSFRALSHDTKAFAQNETCFCGLFSLCRVKLKEYFLKKYSGTGKRKNRLALEKTFMLQMKSPPVIISGKKSSLSVKKLRRTNFVHEL